MEAKKSKKANLENKRGSFLLTGIVVASSMALMAFEWSTMEMRVTLASAVKDDEIEMIDFNDNIEIEKIEMSEPIAKASVEMSNEEIEVVDKIIEAAEEELEDQGEENDFAKIPSLDSSLIISKKKYENFDTTDYTKTRTLADVEVPYYDYCAELSKKEKIDCISKEVRKYIDKELNFVTTDQLSRNKQAKMYVQFVINKEGFIEQVQIAKEEMFDKDVVKMVKKSFTKVPQMNPARKNGKPVGVFFSQPINFVIE